MFERYTEKARRTIFFARYEASQFGSRHIETEHLLLGLMREDRPLAERFLRLDVEAVRRELEGRTAPTQKISTSVDLPLSTICKRVLTYGAEEAERLNHLHIGPEHLLLGLLREESGFAAQLLKQHGVTYDHVREQLQQSRHQPAQGQDSPAARLDQWLTERTARGDLYAVQQRRVGSRTAAFAIYAAEQRGPEETAQEEGPARKLAEIQGQIESLVEEIERSIASHDFEKARAWSGKEREAREALRVLREQFHLEGAPARVPLLCIEILRDERFSDVQKRCDGHIGKGVRQVWLLEPELKRAYVVTKADGLHEFQGEVLRSADPPLELDLRTIF